MKVRTENMLISLIRTAAIPLVFIALIAFVVGNVSGAGIVTIPGSDWEHGVALCQGFEDSPVELHGEAHMWNKNGIMYVVNEGHINDPEVEELKYWGEHECAQYQK